MIGGQKQVVRCIVGAFASACSVCGAFPLGGVISEGTNVVSGVTIFAGTNQVVSDVNGAYLFTNLTGAFVVTPTQAANFFNPAHRTLTMQAGLTNVNFERGVSNVTTMITTCDQASFALAATNGGTIEFDCDGTIVFTNYVTVTNKTFSLDAGTRDVTLDGGGTTRFLRVWSATCSVANLTFTRGRAPLEFLDGSFEPAYMGGAFLVYRALLSVESCTFISNACLSGSLSSSNDCSGGAVYVFNGSLNATNSSFIANKSESGQAFGGALYNAVTYPNFQDQVAVNRCLFDGNRVRSSGDIVLGYECLGGAIHTEAVGRTTVVHVANSTFVSNFAKDVSGAAFHAGNAINNASGSRLDVTNCTFKDNFTGSNEFQSCLNSQSATTQVRACIFQDLGTNREAYEARGAFQDMGFNLVRDNPFPVIFTNATSQRNVDALLTELGDHGGPTRTCALLAGSPALDAITNGASPPIDQRGALRPYGSASDIGAFESYPSNFVFSSFTPTGSTRRVQGTAQPVTPVLLQSSTDLVEWIAVYTNVTGANGTFDLVDAANSNLLKVFYRTYWP